MLNDRENEIKVKKYAEENRYTILANTFGALEYVKYCYVNNKISETLKWPKGSDTFSITKEGITKINITGSGNHNLWPLLVGGDQAVSKEGFLDQPQERKVWEVPLQTVQSIVFLFMVTFCEQCCEIHIAKSV